MSLVFRAAAGRVRARLTDAAIVDARMLTRGVIAAHFRRYWEARRGTCEGHFSCEQSGRRGSGALLRTP